MSDIQQYLDDLKNATTGPDLRNAIHNSITQLYKDCKSRDSTDIYIRDTKIEEMREYINGFFDKWDDKNNIVPLSAGDTIPKSWYTNNPILMRAAYSDAPDPVYKIVGYFNIPVPILKNSEAQVISYVETEEYAYTNLIESIRYYDFFCKVNATAKILKMEEVWDKCFEESSGTSSYSYTYFFDLRKIKMTPFFKNDNNKTYMICIEIPTKYASGAKRDANGRTFWDLYDGTPAAYKPYIDIGQTFWLNIADDDSFDFVLGG